ncbi:hypothetical protein [Paenibacillus ferrarius]|uniref:hypothetical protein n=1 Tax=Paenibacillus ferrarius TaxID=1469647 RepID=UPI00117F5257|nr:hypothetical protein [Paenibacillus ferrarius]
MLILVSVVAVLLLIGLIAQMVSVHQIKETSENQGAVIAELREANKQLRQEVNEYKQMINTYKKQQTSSKPALTSNEQVANIKKTEVITPHKTSRQPDAKWETDNSLTNPNNLTSPLHPLNQNLSSTSSKPVDACDDSSSKHHSGHSKSSCHSPSSSNHSHSNHHSDYSSSHSSSDYSSSSSSDSGSSTSSSDSGGSWGD